MRRESLLALGFTAVLLIATACGPRDAARTTSPRAVRPGPEPNSEQDADPRATPPPRARGRTAPGRPSAGPTCPRPGGALLAPVLWPTSMAHLRRYFRETRLAKVATTKATPVEVCGAHGQVAWLLRARCPDGSAPFTDPRAAHRSRVGNVGPGGRCNKTVDLYKVPCPGSSYSIYMSLYHCAPGQSLLGPARPADPRRP